MLTRWNSNYIRRGGNPNVAKNSDTVKNVKEGYGLIHALIAVKNTSALQRIIDAGAKINAYPLTSKREDRITPIILASKLGYMNGVRLLIKHGGIDILLERGPYGENALHAAVQSGSDEMAEYVLRASQNTLLEKPDNNGTYIFKSLYYVCN
jgi:ankyrin repeat protein